MNISALDVEYISGSANIEELTYIAGSEFYTWNVGTTYSDITMWVPIPGYTTYDVTIDPGVISITPEPLNENITLSIEKDNIFLYGSYDLIMAGETLPITIQRKWKFNSAKYNVTEGGIIYKSVLGMCLIHIAVNTTAPVPLIVTADTI